MGPNSQLTRSSPIKMGKYGSINESHSEHFKSGSEIIVDLNHNQTGTAQAPYFITGSFEEQDIKSGHQRSKQTKNGNRNTRKNHQISKHYKRIFTCSFCGYVTDRKNNLARHVSTMHDTCKQLLECCGMRFESKATFRYHINECHREGYGCSICGHNFHRKALLKRHMSIHNGRKEFTCSECNYGTSHKSNLERHKKVHSKDVLNQKKPTEAYTIIKENSSTPSSPIPSPLPFHHPQAVTTDPITSPREGTSPSDQGLPLKKRHLRLGENLKAAAEKNDKQVTRNEETEWKSRPTFAVEQTQPLDLQIQSDKHPSDHMNLMRGEPYPMHMHSVNEVPWTLLTYRTQIPRHVSYPNMYPVLDTHSYSHNHSYHQESPQWKEDQEQEEVSRSEIGRNRIMATPYKCFECNCRFSSQLSLALHLQSCHPMADVVTLSIVTVLNNMNKLRKANLDEDPSRESQYQRQDLQQFLTEL